MILVTGSTGFIGSQLCRALVARGFPVRAYHRAASSLRGLEGLPVEHFIGDLSSELGISGEVPELRSSGASPASMALETPIVQSLREAMRGVEAVFHVAAHIGPVQDAQHLQAVTVGGTRAVMQAALEAGVRRVVYTSSVAALGVPEENPFGVNGAAFEINEAHSWNYTPEGWPYGYAKYQAELEVQKAVALGLDAVIVNPALVIGAGEIYRQSSSLIAQVARGRLRISAPGGLNCVHVADVVQGHLAAWEHGCTGERYILGGQNMPIAALMAMIARTAGVPQPGIQLSKQVVKALVMPASWAQSWLKLPMESELLRLVGINFYYDTQKGRTALGLGDPRPIEQAVREAYDWLKASPL